ncbi:MAG: WhiB family transcriptional regulator [Trebonia sp.]
MPPVTTPGPAAPVLGDWHRRALCAGQDPDIFFPSHGDPGTKARKTCTGCTVRDDCLRYATEADEFGIWGGLDQRERQKLKRRQRRRMAATRTAGKVPGNPGGREKA